MFPWRQIRLGGTVRMVKLPALRWRLGPLKEPLTGIRTRPSDTRYSVRTAKSERAEDGHLEVLADHSTEGQSPMADR